MAGVEPATAFGRVCQKPGIEIIPAYSAQANAPVEIFFATSKKELVAGESFYNGWRRTSSIGYLSPATFEEQVAL